LVLPVVAAVLAAAAATGSAHAQSDCSQERALARETAARIEREWPLRPDDAVTDFVRRLGRRLAEHAPPSPYPWTFTVVRDRSPNAFAIGAGAIYLHDGTIAAAQNEAEVAAVLAHEMGHQLAGHFCAAADAAPGWPGLLGELFGGDSAIGRSVGSMRQAVDPVHEREADRLSLLILQDAGYDPRAALDIAQRGTRDGFGHRRRTEELAAMLARARPRGRFDLDHHSFDAARRQVIAESDRDARAG
jgi:predicted Zn-dependent protease